jgi:hypothetical protein
MGKQPRSQPGLPVTLANMHSLGVRSLVVRCELCLHEGVLDTTSRPDHVPVPTFGPRMVCSSGRGARRPRPLIRLCS